MSKVSKMILIIISILLLLLNINFVQATEENLESEPVATSEETLDETQAAEQVNSSLEALSTSSVTRVSTVNSYEQANLHLNNILSIILISIGVLLILFAIAILIRLKK